MKYVVVQPDGMSDRPIAELGGATPLEFARTPNLDLIAAQGTLGLTATIPPGFPPGSDVGTMSVLGYDPAVYHTGRSPIEAASMGVDLGPQDVAFRLNLVTVEPDGEGREIMVDFTSGHISTEEATQVIEALRGELGGNGFEFYAGVGYRHLMVWRNGEVGAETTPPHDITGKPTAGYLPKGEGAEVLNSLMERSRRIITGHPVSRARRASGKRAPTVMWLWGQGRRPRLPTLKERFGLEGAVIAAVDLARGLGVLGGLTVIDVPGATGFTDTNYLGKAQYGLRALAEKDFLFIHVEAPDEAGHQGDVKEKVRAIEEVDAKVVGTLLSGLERYRPWRMLVMPDHPTPCAIKTHADDPVPFGVLRSDCRGGARGRRFSERDARDKGIMVPKAHELLAMLVEGRI